MKKSASNSLLEVTAVEFTFKQFVYPLALALLSAGWSVKVSYHPDVDSSFQSALQRNGIQYIPITFYRRLNPSLLFKSFTSLYTLLLNDNSKVVHVHTPLLSYLARILFILPGFRRSRKLIYTVHGFYFSFSSFSLTSLVHILLEILLLGVCDSVLFVSREDYHLASPFLRFLNVHHYLIGNGVDTDLFSPDIAGASNPSSMPVSRSAFANRRFTIGFVGRLVREKGLDELTRAFAQFKCLYPASRIIFVGDRLDSDYDSSVQSQLNYISELYPHSVYFAGMVDDKASIASLLKSFDVFCLPSFREGLPTSLIEAMSCGVPCIASNVRGCNELICHKKNGILVRPRSSNEIVSALSFVVSNPQIAAAMALEGRRTVVADYTLSKVIELQTKIFADLVA